ncbi:hypothetical protein GFL51_17705 [Rhizobium leguminosarum bv. viciae]|nr:hypothetical protein [Rhizobium leguminosarum bv. viciae]
MQEVSGSIPLSSTSLRASARQAGRLDGTRARRKRRLPRRSCEATEAGYDPSMKYVYILHSTEFPDRYYVGVTSDLKSRLAKHNAGEVSHTSKYLPWSLKTYLAFSDETQAFAFEKYLKSVSGRAFAKKRL